MEVLDSYLILAASAAIGLALGQYVIGPFLLWLIRR